MISIRPLLMLFVLSAMALGCSKEEPKKAVTITPEVKATQDKSHEEMKKKMEPAGSTTPASAPK